MNLLVLCAIHVCIISLGKEGCFGCLQILCYLDHFRIDFMYDHCTFNRFKYPGVRTIPDILQITGFYAIMAIIRPPWCHQLSIFSFCPQFNRLFITKCGPIIAVSSHQVSAGLLCFKLQKLVLQLFSYLLFCHFHTSLYK